MWPRFVSRPQYAALEADRTRHRQASVAVANESREPATTLVQVPVADESRAAAPAAASPPRPNQPASAVATRGLGYWPDFRGPNRDGHYVETAIRTAWPRDGLPRLWKQPVGIGYASFVVADGRAFTIEQRRGDEVVAAYDVETGRELWTDSWEGKFRDRWAARRPARDTDISQ